MRLGWAAPELARRGRQTHVVGLGRRALAIPLLPIPAPAARHAACCVLLRAVEEGPRLDSLLLRLPAASLDVAPEQWCTSAATGLLLSPRAFSPPPADPCTVKRFLEAVGSAPDRGERREKASRTGSKMPQQAAAQEDGTISGYTYVHHILKRSLSLETQAKIPV